MKQSSLTFKIPDNDESGEGIRLSDFLDFMGNIEECLTEIDHSVTKTKKSTADYKIVKMTKSSPLLVTIEAIPKPGTTDITATLMSTFYHGVEDLQSGRDTDDLDRPVLESLKYLTKTLKKLPSVTIALNGYETPITTEIEQNIDKHLGNDTFAMGSLNGKLESVNIHGKPTFYIYPVVGRQKVKCEFSGDLLSQVKEAIGSYVSVKGRLSYRSNEYFPYLIKADFIEIYPPKTELPSLYDLRGIAPKATGDTDTVEFIRALRDVE